MNKKSRSAKADSPGLVGKTLAEIFDHEESVGVVSAKIADELEQIRRRLPEHERGRVENVRVGVVQLSSAVAKIAEEEYRKKLDWILIRLSEVRSSLDAREPTPKD